MRARSRRWLKPPLQAEQRKYSPKQRISMARRTSTSKRRLLGAVDDRAAALIERGYSAQRARLQRGEERLGAREVLRGIDVEERVDWLARPFGQGDGKARREILDLA